MASPAAPTVELPTNARTGEQTGQDEHRPSGIHRVERARPELEGADDWSRLVDLWDAHGYGDTPPKCMAAYAEDLAEALD